MTRRRKITVAGCATLAVLAFIGWPRAHGPTYEGRTVEEWFKSYDEMSNKGYYDAVRGVPPSRRQPVNSNELALAEAIFKRLGTNAVPYLAGRIAQDHSYSRMDVWRIKIRWRLPQMLKGLLPLPASSEAGTAADVLGKIKPPGEMLLPLLEPALRSTNEGQRLIAIIALSAISSGYDLAQPHLDRGLKDPDRQVQQWAANAVRNWGPKHGKWAIGNLLELAGSSDLRTFEGAIHALNSLRPDSWPVVPRLKEMLAVEQDEKRREVIAHSIDYISDFGPPELPKK